jgi:hypothetical protein
MQLLLAVVVQGQLKPQVVAVVAEQVVILLVGLIFQTQ